MFNRYWREYPWYFQLGQYVIFLFVFGSLFGGVLAPLLAPQLSGYAGAVTEETLQTPAQARAIFWTQAIGHIGIFTVPALVFAYLVHPRPAQYLGLRLPGRRVHWLAVVLLMLGLLPLVQGLGVLIHNILPMGETADKLHIQNERLVEKLMNFPTASQALLALFVTAVVAPLGEELMFRGVLLRFTARRSRSAVFPIAVTSAMFALFHLNNPYALLPIMLMGSVLAIIFYATQSLWCSMLGHAIFNGVQVLLYYWATRDASLKAALDTETAPIWVYGAAVLLAFLGGWLLWRTRTPLKPGWSADFSPGEMRQREEEAERRLQ